MWALRRLWHTDHDFGKGQEIPVGDHLRRVAPCNIVQQPVLHKDRVPIHLLLTSCSVHTTPRPVTLAREVSCTHTPTNLLVRKQRRRPVVLVDASVLEAAVHDRPFHRQQRVSVQLQVKARLVAATTPPVTSAQPPGTSPRRAPL